MFLNDKYLGTDELNEILRMKLQVFYQKLILVKELNSKFQ
jgi:hypothetical protein